MIALCSLLAATRSHAQQRVASDFEIAQMQKQLATSRDFNSQISGHLNLGDARLSRNEPTLATAEYELALNVATNERLNARRASEMARYATATAYEGLAAARLGDAARAFALLEEAIRYTSDSAKSWNLYSTAMGLLGKPEKAISASRNAVAIARNAHNNPLDLAVYEYALATALGDTPESEQLLREVVASLRSPAFDSLRRQVVRGEQFEIYSSARGGAAAYLSLLDRAQLRLAQLDELHGDSARARQEYQSVLTTRSDDPIALAALVRLAPNDAERERAFAEAFDANPFSLPLVREFQKSEHSSLKGNVEGDSTGAAVRRALVEMQHGEWSYARGHLDALLEKYPANETLRILRAEAEPQTGGLPKTATPSAAELRAVMALFAHITPEQRAALDAMTFTSTVVFAPAPASVAPGETTFEAGTIDGVPFKFAEPTAFRGAFDNTAPVRLTYRILGVTTVNGADGLLLEPIGLATTTAQNAPAPPSPDGRGSVLKRAIPRVVNQLRGSKRGRTGVRGFLAASGKHWALEQIIVPRRRGFKESPSPRRSAECSVATRSARWALRGDPLPPGEGGADTRCAGDTVAITDSFARPTNRSFEGVAKVRR